MSVHTSDAALSESLHVYLRKRESAKVGSGNGSCISNKFPYAPCMVYLPTKLGDFVRANVGEYTSTMKHMGYRMNRPPCGETWGPAWENHVFDRPAVKQTHM